MTPKVKRKSERILGDPKRVIARPHIPGGPERIMQRVIALPEETAASLLEQVMLDFAERHRDINHIFKSHLKAVKEHLPADTLLSGSKQRLLGAYFTMEYSIESAALFNPSIVPHPDQSGVEPGALRFILSLRATGEGHISSIVFRSGILNAENLFAFDPISDYVETPALHLDPEYDRHLIELKLNEMGACNETTDWVLGRLPEIFTYAALKDALADFRREHGGGDARQAETLELIDWLAHSNYETTFRAEYPICERVIFPVSKNESSGIEDARFVRFTGDETYYAMLSRQDGENNHIMFSDHLHFWQESEIIQEPERPWGFIQVGNCGSPLETEAGWLVLTHGVGPMRQYCIGAMLLDLDNPAKIIARLEDPLLTPHEREREGYVPNVVYSCGALIHNNELVVPYAMSDVHSGIATVAVDEPIGCMQPLA